MRRAFNYVLPFLQLTKGVPMYHIILDTIVNSIQPSSDITMYRVIDPWNSVSLSTDSYDKAVSHTSMMNARYKLRNG